MKYNMEEFYKFQGILIGREIPYERWDDDDSHHLHFNIGIAEWDVAIGYGTHGADEGLIEAYDFNSEGDSSGLTAVECLKWVEEHSFDVGDDYEHLL